MPLAGVVMLALIALGHVGSAVLSATGSVQEPVPQKPTTGASAELLPVVRAAGVGRVTVSPAVWTASGGGGTQAVTVAAQSPDVVWTAATSEGWVMVSPAAGIGSGSVMLTAEPNVSSTTARTAIVTIGGEAVVVTQAAGSPRLALGHAGWTDLARARTQGLAPTSVVGPAAMASTSDGGLTGVVQPANGVANAVTNGTFDSGMTGWSTWGPTTDDIVYRVNNGVFEFYRPVGSASGAVLQQTGAPVASGGVVEALFDAGNSTTARKRVSVLLHSSTWEDLNVCTFTLEPGAPMRTYQIRTHATQAWTNATVSIYAANTGNEGDGWYQLDNIAVHVLDSSNPEDAKRTQCTDPTMVSPVGGTTGGNVIANGTFTGGASAWTTYGNLAYEASDNEFKFYKQTAALPSGVVLQNTGQALVAHQPVTVTLQVGNSSPTRQRVTALIHEGDFSDILACTWWIAPHTSLGQYAMRIASTKAWTNATLSIYPATPGSGADYQWLRVDNVTMALTLDTPLGTECFEPGSTQPASSSGAPASVRSGTSTSQVTVLSLDSGVVGSIGSGSSAVPGVEMTSGVQFVDLRDATDARLQFQSWVASRTAGAAVQASLDGLTWTTVADVPAAEDWTWVDVNLGAYLGERVWLRFALTSGAPSLGETPGVWVIDQVRIVTERFWKER